MGKLWLIEGLPGSGKSTFCEALRDVENSATFYSEVDANHPVDVHGVYWLQEQPVQGEVLGEADGGWLVRYGPGDAIAGTDVYELPFEQHARIMLARWRAFVEQVKQDEQRYIFECAFLQNPFTIGMVAQDVPHEQIEAYVSEIAEVVRPLAPTVIYLETQNVEKVFRQVYAERPEGWQTGFVAYYTSQHYAKRCNHQGVDGTIEILKERQEREMKLLNRLALHHLVIPNDERRSLEGLKKMLEVPSCND